MQQYFWVFIGGGIGSICRYGIAQLLPTSQGFFPWATFVANFLACIVLGSLLESQTNQSLQHIHKLFLMAGFCGGFSTFSTFSAETFILLQSNQVILALIYMLLSVCMCVLGIYVGMRLV